MTPKAIEREMARLYDKGFESSERLARYVLRRIKTAERRPLRVLESVLKTAAGFRACDSETGKVYHFDDSLEYETAMNYLKRMKGARK